MGNAWQLWDAVISAPVQTAVLQNYLAPQQNLWVVFYLIDPMELRASEENNDSDASPTGSGCGYMD
ncbi:MAG: hypothetical protein ACREYE_16175, partial [Gammaproteobacteria bacterium]